MSKQMKFNKLAQGVTLGFTVRHDGHGICGASNECRTDG
jgi:hypothetical protein